MSADKLKGVTVAADAIRVNVAMPVTRLGLGPFSFDPVEQMLGVPIRDIL